MIQDSQEDLAVLYTDVTSGLWLLVKQNTTQGTRERVIVWVNIQGVPWHCCDATVEGWRLTEALLSAHQDVGAHHAAHAQETHAHTHKVQHFIPD